MSARQAEQARQNVEKQATLMTAPPIRSESRSGTSSSRTRRMRPRRPWPLTLIRRRVLAELQAAAATGELDAKEAAKLGEQLEDLRGERDSRREADLHIRIERLEYDLEKARKALAVAERGDGQVAVLLRDGEALSAHRTLDGAKLAAFLHYDMPEAGWAPQPSGDARLYGWVISQIPLKAAGRGGGQ